MKMFDLVLTEAYLYFPFVSHEALLTSVKRLAETDVLGKNYQSRFSARKILLFIADQMRCRLASYLMEERPYFSIMVDESVRTMTSA